MSIERISDELPEGFRILPEYEQGVVVCELRSQGMYLCGIDGDIVMTCPRTIYNKCKMYGNFQV